MEKKEEQAEIIKGKTMGMILQLDVEAFLGNSPLSCAGVDSESLPWFTWTCHVTMRVPSILPQPGQLAGHSTCYCKCSAT